ncbi:MAG: hypothetical protein NE327_03110 [Lentisphaeraceae bacterium]|nr:hypothetical protein [Lentisphaeraceae bacterium]
MYEYSFNSCLQNIEDDNYAEFKENFEMGVSTQESEYLLQASIMNHRKFFVEYLINKIELTEEQIFGCQVLSSSNQDLGIFKLFIKDDKAVTPRAWVNIFNIQSIETIKELVELKGKPTENQLVILQYALANTDSQVHNYAFEQLYDISLIETEQSKSDLIDCICFSGNLDLLKKLEGTEEIHKSVEQKQNSHIDFSKNLDEYIDQIFKATPKEKVAQTVNSLNLMSAIQADPEVEDWDIIIQDYLVHEESLALLTGDQVNENAEYIQKLLANKKLALLEIESISPKNYEIKAHNLLESGSTYSIALDRRIHDVSMLYICYLVEIEDETYISSHPMFTLASRKSLIQLGLRKEKDRKQQVANKKNKSKGKKAAGKISLSSKEIYKYLLSEHIQSRKEIDDNV